MATCQRCDDETDVTIMSRFNTDRLCLDCEKKEREHPEYKRAQEFEAEAVRRGDFNFPGIGKPAGL